MKKNDDYINSDKFSQKLRAQPRKSDFHRHKTASHHADVYEDEGRHTHRSEPSKNIIRVQLRRLQQLLTEGTSD